MTPTRTLLITGVSRRIGAHLAAHYLAKGDRVIGTFRHETAELAALRDPLQALLGQNGIRTGREGPEGEMEQL